MKTVFSFVDYRDYLNSYYEAQKIINRGLSLSAFAKKAELKSGAYLKMILDGSRNLTTKNILGFAKATGLSYEETQYFEALVNLNQADNQMMKDYYRQRMKELGKSRPKQLSKNIGKNIFSAWYYPAALVCIESVSKETAVKRLKTRLGLDRPASEKLIEEFVEVDLIRLESGVYVMNAEYFVYQDPTGMKLMHKKYIGEQLQKSQEAFESSYDKGAQFFAHTFTLEKQQLKFFVDKIDSFLQEITDSSNRFRNETVAQLNVQLFEIKPEAGRA